MICLSKNFSDTYINLFARGAQLKTVSSAPHVITDDILMRGITKKKVMDKIIAHGHNYYYMDSGYFGNYPYEFNPYGYKLYFRIVKNNLQHSTILDKPDDRWKKLNLKIENRKKGDHILIVTPSEKPCKYYQINKKQWLTETIDTLKKYTDRKIKIREKPSRLQRLKNTIFNDLNNAHAMVTFNSIAAVESVLYGVPAFTTVDTAADPVSDKDLSKIENPSFQDTDKIYKWACHLAYGQYHVDEFKTGKAYKLLTEQ